MTEYAAKGTLLKMGDGAATEVFTVVAQVADISGPELDSEEAEVTNHSSPGDYNEYVQTTLEAGLLTCNIFYDPADATHDASTGLIYEYEQRAVKNWQLVFPDAATTTWEFAAYVKSFKPAAPVKDALTADVTLRLSGQPTLA